MNWLALIPVVLMFLAIPSIIAVMLRNRPRGHYEKTFGTNWAMLDDGPLSGKGDINAPLHSLYDEPVAPGANYTRGKEL